MLIIGRMKWDMKKVKQQVFRLKCLVFSYIDIERKFRFQVVQIIKSLEVIYKILKQSLVIDPEFATIGCFVLDAFSLMLLIR